MATPTLALSAFGQVVSHGQPAQPQDVTIAETASGCRWPVWYRETMLAADGLELHCHGGPIVVLWPFQEHIVGNREYAVDEFCPGIWLVGTDGGGNGYAFRQGLDLAEFCSVPLVGLSSSAIRCHGAELTQIMGSILARW